MADVTMVHPITTAAGKDSLKKVAWVVAFLLSIAFALLAWALPARSQLKSRSGWRRLHGTANGKQYIAFTVGTPTVPAEVVALALEK